MEIKEVLNEIERIQLFIENNNIRNGAGKLLSDYEKLCYIQDDLTNLSNFIKKSSNVQIAKENKDE